MWPILLLLVLLVAAIASFVQLGNLDKLPAIETGAQPAEGTTVMEPVRKGIRDVTPPSVLRPPPPDEDRIARLPALIVPTPKRPAKPDYWKRPHVVAAGILDSQGTRIVLEGISPLLPDQVCGPRNKTWPCGKFAHTAFQRLIRQRAISCNPVEGDSSGAIHTRCRVSGHDLGGWLVKQGWATAIAGSGYETLESEARQNRKGKWQKGAE